MLIDRERIMNLKDWKRVSKLCKTPSGPYFITKPRPETPLKGIEIEYAKLMGGAYWDEWMVAVRSLAKPARKDRKAFMELWLEDIHDAQRIAWGHQVPSMFDNYDIGFVVWK